MNRIPAFATAAMLSLAPAAYSQVIAYDGFAYPSGQNLDAQSGGFGFSTPWQLVSGTASVQSGSLVPASPSNGLPESGSSVSLTPANATTGANMRRNLTSVITGTAGNSFWISVVMKGAGEIGTTGQGTLSLLDGTIGFNIDTGLGVVGGPSANWSVTGAPPDNTSAASAVPNALQSLLVVKYIFGLASDTLELFVNPPLTGTPPATPNAEALGNHTTNFGEVDLSYTSADGSANSVLFDEIAIGHSFADVTGAAVPEPSSLLLAGFAGVGLLVRRRNRTT